MAGMAQCPQLMHAEGERASSIVGPPRPKHYDVASDVSERPC